jgi:hypothetical protein
MKRRSLLRTVAALPASALAQKAYAQQERTAARDKGLPAGPPLVPPGIEETPNTPVTPADQTSESRIRTFDAAQYAALTRLGDIIVPAWDGKPGARETNSAEFLDFLVGCSPPERIALYRSGLDRLDEMAQHRFAKRFAEITDEQAAELLVPLRQQWTYGKASGDQFSAFLFAAKSDLLRATVNSKGYIDAVSQTRRPRNASNFYWYAIE